MSINFTPSVFFELRYAGACNAGLKNRGAGLAALGAMAKLGWSDNRIAGGIARFGLLLIVAGCADSRINNGTAEQVSQTPSLANSGWHDVSDFGLMSELNGTWIANEAQFYFSEDGLVYDLQIDPRKKSAIYRTQSKKTEDGGSFIRFRLIGGRFAWLARMQSFDLARLDLRESSYVILREAKSANLVLSGESGNFRIQKSSGDGQRSSDKKGAYQNIEPKKFEFFSSLNPLLKSSFKGQKFSGPRWVLSSGEEELVGVLESGPDGFTVVQKDGQMQVPLIWDSAGDLRYTLDQVEPNTVLREFEGKEVVVEGDYYHGVFIGRSIFDSEKVQLPLSHDSGDWERSGSALDFLFENGWFEGDSRDYRLRLPCRSCRDKAHTERQGFFLLLTTARHGEWVPTGHLSGGIFKVGQDERLSALVYTYFANQHTRLPGVVSLQSYMAGLEYGYNYSQGNVGLFVEVGNTSELARLEELFYKELVDVLGKQDTIFRANENCTVRTMRALSEFGIFPFWQPTHSGPWKDSSGKLGQMLYTFTRTANNFIPRASFEYLEKELDSIAKRSSLDILGATILTFDRFSVGNGKHQLPFKHRLDYHKLGKKESEIKAKGLNWSPEQISEYVNGMIQSHSN